MRMTRFAHTVTPLGGREFVLTHVALHNATRAELRSAMGRAFLARRQHRMQVVFLRSQVTPSINGIDYPIRVGDPERFADLANRVAGDLLNFHCQLANLC
jgi:hypothetical protein